MIANLTPAATDGRPYLGELYLGLISGTSADGIDAALVAFDPHPRLLGARTWPMADALRSDVLRLSQSDSSVNLDELGALDTALAIAFAAAAQQLLTETGISASAVRAIGSHGQTLRHRPTGDTPFTLQLGDGHVIAERTGITTVADFRRRDVAAGGQGAPLMPAFHAAVLGSAEESRAVLNLGGIANLTLLAPGRPVRGFDTGPANGLMDAWCARHRGEPFDRDGAFAAAGTVHPRLLERLLADPWLALPAPKSTGRDHYHLPWLAPFLVDLACRPEDVQASLCAFTAHSIRDALQRELPDCHRLLVCGGGVHNRALMATLADVLPGVTVESTAGQGLDPDFVEAMGFAWLARERLAGRPGNLPEVTGARGLRLLGSVYPA